MSQQDQARLNQIFTSRLETANQRIDDCFANIKPSREILVKNRTYYVRTDGSDSNRGMVNDAANAFLTIQHAIDVVSDLDISIYNATIQVADGTYSEDLNIKQVLGAGNVYITGNIVTPENVIIASMTETNVTTIYHVQGFKFVKNVGDVALRITNSYLTFGLVNFGAGYLAHIYSSFGGVVVCNANYTISSGATYHWLLVDLGSIIVSSATITLTGTPAFVTSFLYCTDISSAYIASDTFTGGATGKRYTIQANSAADTGGAATTYLPGNVAGTTATGGQYL
jgi:hypothetical protein